MNRRPESIAANQKYKTQRHGAAKFFTAGSGELREDLLAVG
jgi:hypothetical protein